MLLVAAAKVCKPAACPPNEGAILPTAICCGGRFGAALSRNGTSPRARMRSCMDESRSFSLATSFVPHRFAFASITFQYGEVLLQFLVTSRSLAFAGQVIGGLPDSWLLPIHTRTFRPRRASIPRADGKRVYCPRCPTLPNPIPFGRIPSPGYTLRSSRTTRVASRSLLSMSSTSKRLATPPASP